LLSKGDNACQVKEENVFAGLLIYASYLYLFSVFFIQRFLFPAKAKGKSQYEKIEKTAPNSPMYPNGKESTEIKEPINAASFEKLSSTSRLHKAMEEIDQRFPNLRTALSLIEGKDEETQSFLEHLNKVKGTGN